MNCLPGQESRNVAGQCEEMVVSRGSTVLSGTLGNMSCNINLILRIKY